MEPANIRGSKNAATIRYLFSMFISLCRGRMQLSEIHYPFDPSKTHFPSLGTIEKQEQSAFLPERKRDQTSVPEEKSHIPLPPPPSYFKH